MEDLLELEQVPRKKVKEREVNSRNERFEIVEGFEVEVYERSGFDIWKAHLEVNEVWIEVGRRGESMESRSVYDFKNMKAYIYHIIEYESSRTYKLEKKGRSLVLIDENSEVKEVYSSKSSVYQTYLCYEHYHSEAGLKQREVRERKRLSWNKKIKEDNEKKLKAALKLNKGKVAQPVYVTPVDAQGNPIPLDKNKFLRDLGL